MNPYPYGPETSKPMYQQPPPGAYPPPQGVYPPPGGAYAPNTVAAYPQAAPVPLVTAPVVAAAPVLFGGMQFVYVQDPMTELASCPSLLIRQEPEFIAAMTGCEQPNIYHVFGNSPLGVKYLFKCMERSNCCARRFCPSTNTPLDLDIIHCSSVDQLGIGYTTPFATMNKPFKCTILCLCRPEIKVVLNSSGQVVGKVNHACTVCDPTFDLYDSSGNLKYIVSGSCCQCAILCPNMLGKMSQGVFEIYEAGSKNPVGRITKEPANMSELVTDADSYSVIFPPNSDANDRLLLMGLTLLLDYQFFETDAEDKNKKRSGRSTGRVSVKARGRRY